MRRDRRKCLYIKCLKSKNDKNYNYIRTDETIYDNELYDILLKLPPPTVPAGTARKVTHMSFGEDLSGYKLIVVIVFHNVCII